MSITVRRHIAAVGGHAATPEPAGAAGRHGATPLAWLAGIGTLTGLGLLAGLYLAWQEPAGRPPAETPALAYPPRPEPATLAGMGRAMAALERDLTVWHRLVAPQGPLDLASLRAGLQPGPAEAAAPAPAPPASAPPAEDAAEPDPGRLVLVVLAVLLASTTLVAGLAALLLERLLLGPFRALRSAAAALAEGALDRPIPGLSRDDEAGALARSLERIRHLALAAQAEREAEPASLAEAGQRLEAAARQIECAAAAAAALALEATLHAGQSESSGVAQGVWDLSHQVVAVREAAERAVDAIAGLSQATPTPDRAAQGEPARMLETLFAR
jgi:HAMP domain-containing protein